MSIHGQGGENINLNAKVHQPPGEKIFVALRTVEQFGTEGGENMKSLHGGYSNRIDDTATPSFLPDTSANRSSHRNSTS
jgi:hypothetical protein